MDAHDFLAQHSGQSDPQVSDQSPVDAHAFLSQYSQPQQPQGLPSSPQPLLPNPDDVASADAQIGNQGYNGLCQAFVEQVTGSGWKGATAFDAWQNQQDKAVQGTNGIKPGDILYFTPNASNEGNGHTGIYQGNNQFISATDNGVKPYDLGEWSNLTGQQILGYIPQGAKQ